MSKFVKYPRTYHLPWSQSLTSDDKMMPSIEQFEDKRVIVTEKWMVKILPCILTEFMLDLLMEEIILPEIG